MLECTRLHSHGALKLYVGGRKLIVFLEIPKVVLSNVLIASPDTFTFY